MVISAPEGGHRPDSYNFERVMIMIERYEGRAELARFEAAIDDLPGGVVSPGGAAAILRVSRQAVEELIRTNPRVRAWAFYQDPGGKRASLLYVSVRDLVLFGVQRGRLTCPDDSGLSFPHLAEEIELAKEALDRAKEALVY